jgi:phosphonate transport system substrate-binding protein
MKKIILAILSALVIFSLTACSQNETNEASKPLEQQENKVFKIGAIPDQNATDIAKNMEAIAKYIEEQTKLDVEFVPSVDYAALVTAFERGEIQLAWFGGLTGVQARAVSPGSEAIAQRPMDAKFKSVFIAQKDLNITSLEEIKGKTFTFGSESSTSGSLMPRYFLTQAGINAENDLNGKPNYSGSHDKTIKLVESGAFQTGALNIQVWESLIEQNKVDLSKVKVFYTTPEYFDYHWTINNLENVDKIYGEGTKAKVKEALLSINETNQPEIMKFFKADKFIETNNENYKAIEEVGKSLGMVK